MFSCAWRRRKSGTEVASLEVTPEKCEFAPGELNFIKGLTKKGSLMPGPKLFTDTMFAFQRMLDYRSQRHNVVSSNLSNAETPAVAAAPEEAAASDVDRAAEAESNSRARRERHGRFGRQPGACA